MTTLHTINKPLNSPSALRMRETLASGDSVLLIEEACNSLASQSEINRFIENISETKINWYAFDKDCIARGLQTIEPFEAASGEQFVQLVSQTDKTVSWY